LLAKEGETACCLGLSRKEFQNPAKRPRYAQNSRWQRERSEECETHKGADLRGSHPAPAFESAAEYRPLFLHIDRAKGGSLGELVA
jgi:hypothetical protein